MLVDVIYRTSATATGGRDGRARMADGVDKADAERLVHAAHEVCPYSNATRNNVDVWLTVT